MAAGPTDDGPGGHADQRLRTHGTNGGSPSTTAAATTADDDATTNAGGPASNGTPPGGDTITGDTPMARATTAAAPTTGDQRSGRRTPATALVVGGLTAIVVVPLGIALVALHSPRWFPLLDLAMTELRVRDVGTSHTPLIGLVGRLSSNGHQGSHPGPISFWALAPVYRLLGGSAWSLFVGVVVLNTTAIGLTLWVALRRGGAALALGFAAAIAVLLHLYGSQVLTEPWNPYLPVMWWPLTLVALWAVLCDDLAMLPVAVFAASFCMQTHISYLGLVGGLAALCLAGLAVRAYGVRGDRPALRRVARWGAISLALGLVLWLPTLIDQVTGDPGNASIVVDHFLHADEEPIGVGRGGELFGVHLNLWRLLAGQHATSGSVVPGVLLVAAWLAAAIVTWRLPATAAATGAAAGAADGAGGSGHRRPLLRLHAVVAVALVLGLISSTRILGFIWFYLTLWAWSITVLAVVAIAWTVVVTASRATLRPVAARAGVGVLAVVLVAWTTMSSIDAVDAEPTQANYSAMVGSFTTAVTSAIDDEQVEGGGPDGRYVLTWTDGVNLGSTGYGLLAELERRGYDVGIIPAHGPGARPHRVMPTARATAEIHISLGPDIPVWQQRPGAEQVVYVDLRTDDQVAEYERARVEAIEHLERLGRDELVPVVDKAPFQLYFDESLPQETRDVVQIIADIGQPAAVFIGPVTLAR
jgi:hypothetical protein